MDSNQYIKEHTTLKFLKPTKYTETPVLGLGSNGNRKKKMFESILIPNGMDIYVSKRYAINQRCSEMKHTSISLNNYE